MSMRVGIQVGIQVSVDDIVATVTILLARS